MAIVNGDNIEMIRQIYRLSREEFGALIGVSARFVSLVEHKERKLPETRALLAEKELGLTPDKLARIYDIYQETQVSPKT